MSDSDRRRLVRFLLGSMIAAPVYALTQLIPLIGRLSVFLAFFLGVAASQMTVGAVAVTERDSFQARLGIGLAATTWVYAWSWYFWCGLVLWMLDVDFSWLSLLWPPSLIDALSAIASHGAWSTGMMGTPVRGTALVLVWLCEVALVYGGAVYGALKHTGDVDD